MNALLANLLLALAWTAFQGQADATNLVVGFLLGYAVLALVRPLIGTGYHGRLPRAVAFVGFFLKELVLSTVRVAWEVLTPTAYRKPGIVAVPLDARTDLEITLLANLITLTPGTLSLDVASDRSVLYVHCMFVDDPATIVREIKEGLERRILALVR